MNVHASVIGGEARPRTKRGFAKIILSAAGLLLSAGCGTSDEKPGLGSSGSTNSGGSAGEARADASVTGASGQGGGTGSQDGSTSDGSAGWVQIFNGVDLSGWKAKITHYAYGDNYANTFRVENGVIKVSYDGYDATGFGGDTGKFGLLYWTTPLSRYRVRVEYRFTDPQAENPPSWGLRNSGLMIFGEDPAGVGVDVIFPSILEIQLLGRHNTGNTSNGNLCPLGGASAIVDGTRRNGGCTGSTSLPFSQNPNFADDAWVTVEAEVHGNSETRVTFAGDNGDQPVLIWNQPMANGMLLGGGYLALQSESHPIEFRKVELMDLSE